MHGHLNIKNVEGSVRGLNSGIAVAYAVFASCSERVRNLVSHNEGGI